MTDQIVSTNPQDDQNTSNVVYNKFGVPVGETKQPEVAPAQPPVEIVSTPEAPAVTKPVDQTTQSAEKLPQNIAPQKEPTVLDTRTNKEELHKIKPTADTTTKKADAEEEEFIKDVEAAHDTT